jgi:hypothetical protein
MCRSTALEVSSSNCLYTDANQPTAVTGSQLTVHKHTGDLAKNVKLLHLYACLAAAAAAADG